MTQGSPHRFILLSLCHVCLLSILFFMSAGCNEAFQPIKNSETSAFSMFGYLDASADTQWVRIAPLRDEVATPSVLPGMHVTLEHPASGDKVVMKDSLFNLAAGFTAVNVYSSEMDIKPEETYRIRAERSDGATSQVTVTIPPDFPTPVIRAEGFYEEDGDMYLKDIEKVADVLSIWQYDGDLYVVPYRFRVRPINSIGEYDYLVDFNATFAMQFIYGEDAPPPYATEIYEDFDLRRQVFVASGGPAWMESIIDLSDEAYSSALSQTLSNVENGVGYVVGIVSKTIPFKSCMNDEGELIGCPLEKPIF